MRRRARQLALASLPLAFTLAGTWTQLAGAVEFTPCPEHFGFSCATVVVPLDRSGVVPGTISLKLQRKQAGVNPTRSALIALSGGPGQAAIPSVEEIAKSMAPALNNRDLVVFDQRGTGQTGPLNCPALSSEQAAVSAGSITALFNECALQIGPARGFFTTRDSVEDIEAIRQALGYEKLVLRGVSYGTKVALQYAERYPQNVEALMLDSVVSPTGPDALEVPTFQSIAPVLGELCASGACARITSNPVKDVAQLAAQLRTHPLNGVVYDGSGHRHTSSFSELDLMGVLEAGDLNPALRALLPAAVRSALRHDPQPLLRLGLLATGRTPSVPGTAPPLPEEGQEGNALYWATRCEETLFPWGRTDPPAMREAQAKTALNALPSSDFYPFDAGLGLAHSLLPECVGWPDAAQPPPPTGPLPNVPTLILSGEQDMRTPTSVARGVAAEIPDAELLTVPFTGHSVLGTDFSGCAKAAVIAFFASSPVQPCTGSNLFTPTPVTPTQLAYVHSPQGVNGRDGRTLTAVLDTVLDINRQMIGATLQANATLPAGASFGGLRGGYARVGSSSVRLSRYSLLPGVEVSGSFPLHDGKLLGTTVKIEGSAAATGTVKLGSNNRVTGTLSGRHFNLSVTRATLSRVGAGDGDWSVGGSGFPLPRLVRTR
jgi:pimeloyl-ACP methyl ester carboxylesterase